MTLFDVSEQLKESVLPVTEATPLAPKKTISNKNNKNDRLLLFKETDPLIDQIPSIQKDQTIHFVSKGEWSTHDLLYRILDLVGPSEVWIATWSMSDVPFNKIMNLVESGDITELNALLDFRIKIRNPKVFQFIKANLTKLAVTQCHAKITLIQNADFNVTIVGSANYTNNPRIETGCIIEGKEVLEFHKEWIDAEIRKKSILC